MKPSERLKAHIVVTKLPIVEKGSCSVTRYQTPKVMTGLELAEHIRAATDMRDALTKAIDAMTDALDNGETVPKPT